MQDEENPLVEPQTESEQQDPNLELPESEEILLLQSENDKQPTPTLMAVHPVQNKDFDLQIPSTSSQGLKSPFAVSPQDIRPIPSQTIPRTQHKSDKRRGKTAIITSSPYKLELENEEKERMNKEKN